MTDEPKTQRSDEERELIAILRTFPAEVRREAIRQFEELARRIDEE